MKLPIFIYETGDISAFETKNAAEASVESIDVRHNRYKAFDSEGRLLLFKIQNERTGHKERVVLEEAESSPTHQDELKSILNKFLLRTGTEADWINTASFDDLVKAAAQKGSYR